MIRWRSWTLCSVLGVYVLWYFYFCQNASYLKCPLSIFIAVFQLQPCKRFGLSLSLLNNTDANVSETPGAFGGSWNPLKASSPHHPFPLGPIFLVWGFKVLSWALCLVAVSANVCQTEWQWASHRLDTGLFLPLSLKIDLFSRAKQIQ